MRVLFVLLALACLSGCCAKQRFVYTGFDHLVAFNTESMTATAFDFRRHLDTSSTCDMFGHPPLVESAKIEDWVSQGALSTNSQDAVSYTYLGYENFLVEHKETGAYVVRRCRDFRPQLSLLPCEAFATGQSDRFKSPQQTVFIGNNRIMIVNAEEGTFTVHPFDADVHSGGDPFKFVEGPLFSGNFPAKFSQDTQFAYVQLKDHGGDLLFVKEDPQATVWKFNGIAKSIEDFGLSQKTVWEAPNTEMIPMSENDLLFVDPLFNFERFSIALNESDLLVTKTGVGSIFEGETCLYNNATRCIAQQGCAWCPSSYTCHTYDRVNKLYCDSHRCSVEPLIDAVITERVVVPDCETSPDGAIEMEENVDLPGHVRLPEEYRDGQGEHSGAVASPIHPNIDNELGDDPVVVEEDYQDDVIHENNTVAQGSVYLPPPPSQSAPCMDDGYDSSKAMELPINRVEDMKMNNPVHLFGVAPPVVTTSPSGDATVEKEADCSRAKPNVGSVNATSKVGTRSPSKTEEFAPRVGDSPSVDPIYIPGTTSTRHEEDLMNEDDTVYSDLKAKWLNAASPKDYTRTEAREASPGNFKPKEPTQQSSTPLVRVTPSLRVVEEAKSSNSLMNDGLATKGLAGADCTDNGGDDGQSSPSFNAAMMNSANDEFPESLEDQLDLFKYEQKQIVDPLPPPQPEEQLAHHLPTADDQPDVTFPDPGNVRVGDPRSQVPKHNVLAP